MKKENLKTDNLYIHLANDIVNNFKCHNSFDSYTKKEELSNINMIAEKVRNFVNLLDDYKIFEEKEKFKFLKSLLDKANENKKVKSLSHDEEEFIDSIEKLSVFKFKNMTINQFECLVKIAEPRMSARASGARDPESLVLKDSESENLQRIANSPEFQGVIQITVTIDYVIPKNYCMNMTNEKVYEDWFVGKNLSPGTHATRDAYHIGGSEKIISYKIFEHVKKVRKKK
jgi:hypothetical protein